MDVQQEVKSLKKALRALTFLNQRGDATVSEVAKAIGIPRPTSYRILETLASEGYVEKQPHSDFYRITSLVQSLAEGFNEEVLFVEVARMQELARDITNECLARLDGESDQRAPALRSMPSADLACPAFG